MKAINKLFEDYRKNLNENINENEIIIYGSGNLGRKVNASAKKNNINVVCFIDGDKSKWGQVIDGIEVLSPDDAKNKYISQRIIICIWAPRFDYDQTKSFLYGLGFSKVNSFIILLNQCSEILPHYQFSKLDFYFKRNYEITNFYNLLNDNKSKELFIEQMRWRFSFGEEPLSQPDFNNQYIPEDIIQNHHLTNFLDVGAYDGDTCRSILNTLNSNINSYYAIEPDPINFTKLKKWHDELPNNIKTKISLFNLAISNEGGSKVNFDVSGTGSSISNIGSIQVQTNTIDFLITSEISYLKMDVEGYEMNVLLGAINTIKKYRPVLGICVYHKPEDIFSIGLFIERLALNYSFHIRSHDTQGLELVLYCVPQ